MLSLYNDSAWKMKVDWPTTNGHWPMSNDQCPMTSAETINRHEYWWRNRGLTQPANFPSYIALLTSVATELINAATIYSIYHAVMLRWPHTSPSSCHQAMIPSCTPAWGWEIWICFHFRLVARSTDWLFHLLITYNEALYLMEWLNGGLDSSSFYSLKTTDFNLTLWNPDR